MSQKNQIELLQQRSAELAELMLDVKHPEFDSRVSERNSISVQIEVLKQQSTGRWKPEFYIPSYTVIIPQNK